MAINTNPSSRRALLAGTAAGLAVAAASQLARPLSALAGDGDPVLVGKAHSAEATTSITNNATSETVLRLESTQGPAIEAKSKYSTIIAESSDNVAIQGQSYGELGSPDPKVVGIGVVGRGPQTGVHGESTAGFGVAGITQTGEGVHADAYGDSGVAVSANSPSGIAVQANSDAGPAVWAGSMNGSAVSAWSHSTKEGTAAIRADHAEGDAVVGWSKTTTGVRGIGEDAANGVTGESHANTGVQGCSGAGLAPAAPVNTGIFGYAAQDASARGVLGRSTAGQGVRGEATTGAGGYFTAGSAGTALQVVGKAKFNRASYVKILRGKASYRKTLTGVTSSSQVFAVLRTYRTGTHVAAVVCGTGYFTIYLNRALTADTNVSYFVVN